MDSRRARIRKIQGLPAGSHIVWRHVPADPWRNRAGTAHGTPPRSPLAESSTAGSGSPEQPAGHDVRGVVPPGLGPAVADELTRLGASKVREVAGRADSLAFCYGGAWQHLAGLRTVVAVFVVLGFPVPRPRALSSGEHLPSIVDTMRRVRDLPGVAEPRSFRIDAAGSSSPTFQRIATLLVEATGLRFDAESGDIVVRFRRSQRIADGWDVLVRTSARPLSHRPWRVRNFPGAANATVAATMAQLTRPHPADRVANLLCGSGTLLIERLLAAPARAAVGVDRDPAALACCAANLAAAGVPATLVRADIADDSWLTHGPFDLLLADPPWGDLVGRHAENEAVHRLLLEQAARVAHRRTRFAVLTHEIKLMERLLRRQDAWHGESTTRVFHKGHHPRIYHLRR